VAELRSSVIRINSKNASPAETREEEGEKENVRWWVGGEDRVLYRTTHGDAFGQKALNHKWPN